MAPYYATDLVERCAPFGTSAEIGATFHAALQGLGVTATYVRSYRAIDVGRRGPIEVLARVSPPGWEETYTREGFDSSNFGALTALRSFRPFRWSSAPTNAPKFEHFWETLRGWGFADGLIIPCHGPRGYLGIFSMAFKDIDDISPTERLSIELAGLALHGRMRDITGPAKEPFPLLSDRERDCICFVAEGKSDWEISQILGIAQSTAHTYVETAKKKLGATTRAQAVARLLMHQLS